MRLVESLLGEALDDVRFSDVEGLDYCSEGEELECWGGHFRWNLELNSLNEVCCASCERIADEDWIVSRDGMR